MTVSVEEQADMIRHAWEGTPSSILAEVPGLQEFLEARLSDLVDREQLDERSLLAVVEDASQLALNVSSSTTARDLSRRLRRSVYEFLLALDAMSTQERAPEGVARDNPEEIASPPGARPAAPPEPETETIPEASTEAVTEPTWTIVDDGSVTEEYSYTPPAEESVPASEQQEVATTGQGPSGGGAAGETDSASAAARPVPRSGFHLTDPSDLLASRQFGSTGSLARRMKATTGSSTSEGSARDMVEDDGRTRGGGPTRETAGEEDSPSISGAVEAAEAEKAGYATRDGTYADEGSAPQPSSTGAGASFPEEEEEEEIDLKALRKSIDDLLRRKKCAEAAAMLQQTAQDVGGRGVAEISLDAGDRCKEMGKRHAATNCYLAASRADPIYEVPLQRLADILLDDQELDQAVAYLERIARLTRLRGDVPGAMRVYRRIVNIAPYREDVLELLMRAQTTGRIDP